MSKLDKHRATPFLLRFVIFTAIAVFLCEALILWLNSYFGIAECSWKEVFADAIILTLLVSPVLYFLMFRRMLLYRKESEMAAKDLGESEKRFRGAFDNAAVGMALLGGDGRFLKANNSFCSFLGYAEEELKEMRFADVTHPGDMEQSLRVMEHMLSGGLDACGFEKRYLTKNGDTVWALLHVTAVRGRAGEPLYFLSEAQDITTRKWLEEGLVESEEKYRSMVENAGDAILVADVETETIVEANKKASELLGRPVGEIIGLYHSELYPKDEKGRCVKVFNDAVAQGRAVAEESFVRRKDGHLIPVEITWSVSEIGDRKLVQGTFRDMTEKLALRQETVRAAQLAALGELAAGVAHEINNPVNGIINYAQLLSNRLPGEEGDIARRIIKEGDRISGIVRSLLSFARSDPDRRADVHVEEMLGEVLSLVGAQLRRDGVRVSTEISPGLPEARVNRQQVEQVFLNIINNARHALNRKYQSADGGKALEIRCERAAPDGGGFLRVAFTDNGTGIPADIIDKVAEPFFTTKRKEEGTGLGLSISHEILNRHGGGLSVESVEGEFTTVTVRLPAARRDDGG